MLGSEPGSRPKIPQAVSSHPSPDREYRPVTAALVWSVTWADPALSVHAAQESMVPIRTSARFTPLVAIR